MRILKLSILIAFIIFYGCRGTQTDSNNNEGVKLSEREQYRYDSARKSIEQLATLCDKISAEPTYDAIVNLLTQSSELKYDYDEDGMKQDAIEHCDSLKLLVEGCKQRVIKTIDKVLSSSECIKYIDEYERLITQNTSYPIYLKRGEKLSLKVSSSALVTVKLYNADTEHLIKLYQSKNISESYEAPNTGVYVINLTPKSESYISLSIGFHPNNSSDLLNRPSITSEQVECKKNDFGAIEVAGVKMIKCFDEPKKITLRGQLKAMFSGNAKGLVAVSISSGATDILYSLRIATSESSRSDDGKFHDNLTRSYKRIQFLGLPIYEKSISNGLLNTLLDDNRPIRDEDAYCNMYVFRNQSQAKQFQDGTKEVSSLDYDVDYSTVGTQSCNGRVSAKGARVIYLGFENERMRYTNYLWIEVDAVVPNTIYYHTKYVAN